MHLMPLSYVLLSRGSRSHILTKRVMGERRLSIAISVARAYSQNMLDNPIGQGMFQKTVGSPRT